MKERRIKYCESALFITLLCVTVALSPRGLSVRSQTFYLRVHINMTTTSEFDPLRVKTCNAKNVSLYSTMCLPRRDFRV